MPEKNDNTMPFDITIDDSVLSPNFGDRTLPVSIVVIHYTAMVPTKRVLDLFNKTESQVSSHYVIGEDGAVHRMVDERKRAWHAGISRWGSIQNVNSASIGFELVNPGFGPDYRQFSEPQINALMSLLERIVPQYHIEPWNIVGHSDVAPTRKQDPGYLFPWKLLADRGFGLWPQDPGSESCYSIDVNVTAFYEGLIDYGYTSLALNATDTTKKATTLAFQRHFQPELFFQNDQPVGVPDGVTMYRLNSLLEQKRTLASAT